MRKSISLLAGRRVVSALIPGLGVLAAALTIPVMAQTTTNFSATFTLTDKPDTSTFNTVWLGTGQVGTLGSAVLMLNMSQALADDGNSGAGQAGAGLTLFFTRSDTITIATAGIPDPAAATITVPGGVNGGAGAYAGATGSPGSATLTLTPRPTTPPSYNLSLTGTATVGGQTLNLSITDVPVSQAATRAIPTYNTTGTGTVTPLGDATVNVTGTTDADNVNRFVITVHFNSADSLRFLLEFTGDDPPPDTLMPIIGGTGPYAGAFGSGTLNVASPPGSNTFTATITGSVMKRGPTTPVINAVITASGLQRISPNDWIAIKGINLVPSNTPAGGLYWSGAPEFAQGKMPTELGGISVTVNGKPAYIWWFCSAATTPACATDQINVLTPLDATARQVLIAVTNGSASSAPFLVLREAVSPSLLTFDVKGNATATHLDGSLLGPASLYPGASTPAEPGETVTLWGVGFGWPTNVLTEGAAAQYGSLPSTPACTLGGLPVQVTAALVSPGLYQLNMTVPSNAASGANWVVCTFRNRFSSPVLVEVQ